MAGLEFQILNVILNSCVPTRSKLLRCWTMIAQDNAKRTKIKPWLPIPHSSLHIFSNVVMNDLLCICHSIFNYYYFFNYCVVNFIDVYVQCIMQDVLHEIADTNLEKLNFKKGLQT